MAVETVAPDEMTSRQRVLAALRCEPVDRTPVCNPTSVATVELMDLADAYFPEANREPELMARLAATGHTELGFDTVMPVFSIIQESSALGCRMQWEQKDNWPTVRMREPIWERPEDIEIPDDFMEHPDVQCVLQAIAILRKQFGTELLPQNRYRLQYTLNVRVLHEVVWYFNILGAFPYGLAHADGWPVVFLFPLHPASQSGRLLDDRKDWHDGVKAKFGVAGGSEPGHEFWLSIGLREICVS